MYVETEAGNAFVHLQVGLGKAQHQDKGQQYAGGRRGGCPSRERRRERREAAREASTSAGEAVTVGQVEKEHLVAEEAVEKVDDKIPEAEDVTEENSFVIPQIDGANDGDEHYKLEIEAHDTVTEDDIVEALEANFYGTLEDDEVEKNNISLRYLSIQNLNLERHLENEPRKILNYKISIKENDTARKIIESWKERYNFDELAFTNFDFKNKSIRIREVSRV